jgi:hypothetical protein
MLNFLVLFAINSEGEAIRLRCRMPERAPQLELILFLAGFDPTAI